MTRLVPAVVVGSGDSTISNGSAASASIEQRIVRVREDLSVLKDFYNIDFAPRSSSRLQTYYEEQLAALSKTDFSSYDQRGQIDYLLLQNHLRRNIHQTQSKRAEYEKAECLLEPFASVIIRLCEDRQMMKPIDGQIAADDLYMIEQEAAAMTMKIRRENVNETMKMTKAVAFRAAKTVDRLLDLLLEWNEFFSGYDPLFSWWAADPFAKANKRLKELASAIRQELVGIGTDDRDAIVGQPIGREGLLADLEAEMIPYTPEDLMGIAEKEYQWCAREMKRSSQDLGFGDKWRDALEHVKNKYVAPGEQPQLIRRLATEALEYVQKHDMVTVPPLAEETWRMFMMSPAMQKEAPFFLGGPSILVSYPTNNMDHKAKLMTMRGNNEHFSRATVFHELIPGHRLQFYMNARYRPYGTLFETPFWTEGWSLYWEFILWDRGDFQKSPEDRIGALFWRMHRCARIIFSLKFHLGEMTSQECIDYLIEKVGHERSTAEGEVRRSFGGDYTPLYQAGYMLGAFQFYALRKEVVDGGKMTEKEFHDRILQENQMPIELLRALLLGLTVTPDLKPSWRFYDPKRVCEGSTLPLADEVKGIR